MPPDYLTVTTERRGNLSVLCVSGELDAASSAGFARRITQAVEGLGVPFVVDLSGLAFIDCAGARALTAALGALPAGQVIVTPPPLRVRRVLALLSLDLTHTHVQGGGAPQRQIGPLLERSAAILREAHALMGQLAATYEVLADIRADLARRRQHEADHWLTRSKAARDQAHRYWRLARSAPP